jgi:GGDEF domain-containing protein
VCVVGTEQTADLGDLLKCADQALYQVKRSGKNAVMVYNGASDCAD